MTRARLAGAALIEPPPATRVRVAGVGVSGAPRILPRIRVTGVGVSGSAKPVVAPVVVEEQEPQEFLTIGVGPSASSAIPSSYQWRQISGPDAELYNNGTNTATIYTPSILALTGGDVVLGVKGVLDGVVGDETTITIHIRPQLSWSQAPGGPWVGAKPIVTNPE